MLIVSNSMLNAAVGARAQHNSITQVETCYISHMMRSHSAIYQNGILKLQEPLELPEGARVIVYVEPEQNISTVEAHRAMVREALESLIQRKTPRNALPASRLSEERREELARLFAIGKPLSEILLEGREGY